MRRVPDSLDLRLAALAVEGPSSSPGLSIDMFLDDNTDEEHDWLEPEHAPASPESPLLGYFSPEGRKEGKQL
jgi:hypothetical protein